MSPSPKRVVAYIDGFNLYHAIDDLRLQHLKWLNLWSLAEAFSPPPDLALCGVYYFSAYATWRPASFARHRDYVAALKSVGVVPVMGRFKEKDRRCRKCGSQWRDHEEKETDVNLAVCLIDGTLKDIYDIALVITGDSDIAPAIRMARAMAPNKRIRIVNPVGRPLSSDLLAAAGGRGQGREMKMVHVERSLLPAQIVDAAGQVVAIRPSKYDPPS